MESLFKVLRKEGFARGEFLSEIEKEREVLKNSSKELLEILESNREIRGELYKEQINKENKILEEIKDILAHPIFERIYQNKKNRIRVNNILEPLNNNDVEIFKGSKTLKDIRYELLVILDEQNYLEKKRLKDIENNLGESLWEEFKYYFQKDSFLKIIMDDKNR